MNKSTSRYRRLMEIRSRNSLRSKGYDPKKPFTFTTANITLSLSYKDWVIYKNNVMQIHKKETADKVFRRL